MAKDLTNINKIIEHIRNNLGEHWVTDYNIEYFREMLKTEPDIEKIEPRFSEATIVRPSETFTITYDPGQLISYDTYQHNHITLGD